MTSEMFYTPHYHGHVQTNTMVHYYDYILVSLVGFSPANVWAYHIVKLPKLIALELLIFLLLLLFCTN